MAGKQYWNTEAKNERWIRDGRGQGVGAQYKPWLTVRDVPSQGRSHRIFGHLTQRTHHLLSDLELATFLLLQWRQSTVDIREQFPLERELTRDISLQIGVKHPQVNGVDQFMSSDFVVDSVEQGRQRFVLQVKTVAAFEKARTLEKLQIERCYWSEKNVPFFMVTENQIPPVVRSNVDLLYSHIDDDSNQDELTVYFDLIRKELLVSDEGLHVKNLCIKIDTAYGHDAGESLYQLKRLLAKRYFNFDIAKPFTELRCSDLKAESPSRLQEVWGVSG